MKRTKITVDSFAYYSVALNEPAGVETVEADNTVMILLDNTYAYSFP